MSKPLIGALGAVVLLAAAWFLAIVPMTNDEPLGGPLAGVLGTDDGEPDGVQPLNGNEVDTDVGENVDNGEAVANGDEADSDEEANGDTSGTDEEPSEDVEDIDEDGEEELPEIPQVTRDPFNPLRSVD